MNFELINTNLIFILLGVVVAILGLGLAIYGIFTWLKRGNKISTRLDQFVAVEIQAPDNPIAGQIIPREISGSLFSRTIALWIKNFIRFPGKINTRETGDQYGTQTDDRGESGQYACRSILCNSIPAADRLEFFLHF